MNFNFNDEIILESESLLLRPIYLADIDHLEAIATADKTLLQYSPKPVYTRQLLTEYIEAAIDLRGKQQRYSFSIFSKRAQAYAGSTSFLNVSNADDRLEIGATWLGREFQGTGLNRQCKYLLLHYAFETVHAHKVEFRTDERNTQSRRAIEKTGAKPEGVLREHTVLYDGFRRNTWCYGILKQEWDAMKADFI